MCVRILGFIELLSSIALLRSFLLFFRIFFFFSFLSSMNQFIIILYLFFISSLFVFVKTPHQINSVIELDGFFSLKFS